MRSKALSSSAWNQIWFCGLTPRQTFAVLALVGVNRYSCTSSWNSLQRAPSAASSCDCMYSLRSRSSGIQFEPHLPAGKVRQGTHVAPLRHLNPPSSSIASQTTVTLLAIHAGVEQVVSLRCPLLGMHQHRQASQREQVDAEIASCGRNPHLDVGR